MTLFHWLCFLILRVSRLIATAQPVTQDGNATAFRMSYWTSTEQERAITKASAASEGNPFKEWGGLSPVPLSSERQQQVGHSRGKEMRVKAPYTNCSVTAARTGRPGSTGLYGQAPEAKNSTPSRTSAASHNVTAEALACQSSLLSWSASASNDEPSHSTWTTSTWTVEAGTADVYTSSDGIPVAHGTFTTTGTIWQTSSWLTRFRETVNVFPASPRPDCEIPSSICTSMFSSWMQDRDLTLWIDPIPTAAPDTFDMPRCGEPIVRLNSKGHGTTTIADPCSFWGGSVELFYWPSVTPTPSWHSAAASNKSATVHTEVITTVGNLTMTSPSVYLSLDMLTAWTEGAEWIFDNHTAVNNVIESQVGQTYRNIIISMNPSEVSTLRHAVANYSDYIYSITALGIADWSKLSRTTGLGQPVGTPWPMNFDHLTAPPPEEYFLNPNYFCWSDRAPECATILNGEYRPQLSLPGQLVHLDPHWSACEPYIGGVYDP